MTALATLAADPAPHPAATHTVDLAAGLVQSVDWLAIAPPAVAALVGVAVLVTDLFLPAHRKPLLGWLAIGGLTVAGLLLLPLLNGDRSTFCLTTHPSVCSYTADHFALVIQFLVLGGALLAALLSVHTVAELGLPAGEFWFLLLSSASGAALLPASRDLATLVVALEVATLPVFALVGLGRGHRLSSEAALKFFLSSVTATAVMLLGVSFVYATTGSLHLSQIAEALTHTDPRFHTLARTGVVLTLVGFAFKTAAVPFHFWVPDTYVGAPLPVAAYLSVVGKAVGFSGLILVTLLAFPSFHEVWAPAVAVLAALTMTAGNAAALRQRPERPHSAVRLLAWSSVAQAGYLLVPIAAAGYADSAEEASHAVGSTVAYALMYAVVNLGAFAVAALVARPVPVPRRGTPPAPATDGTPAGRNALADRIADHRGLYASRPLAALALGFFLLSLAGLPPGIIGLFAKVTVFSAAVDAGLGWLAVVMALNVVIALYYYLQWTAVLFRAPAAADTDPASAGPDPAPAGTGVATAVETPPVRFRVPIPLTAAIGLPAVLGLVLSGAPQLILRFASSTLL